MKAVLNITAAVLIAAGLVVAVASLLTPGQVIYGIDFKLAATLAVGGLILLALAKALVLLERMSNDLRQLRKAGGEAPPWLRESAGQSGIQAAAAAAALAEGAAPAEAAQQGPGSEPAQEVGHDIGRDVGERPAAGAQAEWPQASETEWPEVSEVQWPEAPEPAPAEPEVPAAPEAEASREEETELPFLGAPAPAEQAEFEPPRNVEPEPELEAEEPVASASWVEAEPGTEAEETAEVPAEPEPSEPQPSEPQPSEPQPADAAPEVYPEEPAEPPHAAVPDEEEPPRRLKPSQYTPWSPDGPSEAADEQEPSFAAEAPEEPSPEETSPGDQAPEEQPSGEQSALYVVEERMFRGKQARVLSDGTVEAETAEGWMRFEDFDHLEEYLDAMAELGR